MIFLKYTKGYRKTKFKFTAGFYAVVACCLLIVGGASWFTLSKVSDSVEAPKNNESKAEYNDNTSSYIESVPEIPEITIPQKETTQNVSSEPYKGVNQPKKENTNQNKQFSFIMPVEGKVLKEYSSDRLQYSATYNDMRIHKGVDIECEKGAQIKACADGSVLAVVRDSSLGTVVEIDHGNGITLKYAAINNSLVKEGDNVKAGECIGESTTVPSECNEKSHIHLEAYKDGKVESPLEILGLKK